MNRQFRIAIISITILPAIALAGWFGPSNYEECITESMQGVGSDRAATFVFRACRERFPEKKEPPATPAPGDSLYFDTAARLGTITANIGQTMSRYKLDGDLDIARLALWLMSESEAACAGLTGNIIGAAGKMSIPARADYMKMVHTSIDHCLKLTTDHSAALSSLAEMKDDPTAKQFATELIAHILEMQNEFAKIKQSH